MSKPFDFPNAKVPQLLPLERSFEENDVEADCKRLLLALFNEQLAIDVFDANVLGAAHLGSFDLVRKAVNADGLVLLQGSANEEAATRYLYRAWKAGNAQGRGFHFLRIYLQMLFPNQWEVEQLWHDTEFEYPEVLYGNHQSYTWWLHQLGEPGLKLDGTWGLGRPVVGATAESRGNRPIIRDGQYLTSRVRVSLPIDVDTPSTSKLIQVVRNILPARILPEFIFFIYGIAHMHIHSSSFLEMKKSAQAVPQGCKNLTITDNPKYKWNLGRDEAADSSSVPKLGVRCKSFNISASMQFSRL